MNHPKKKKNIVKPLENYHPDIGRILWMLEDTRRRTKHALKGVTEQVLDWSYSQHSNSIGSILYHIAAIEASWLFTEILQKEFPQEVEDLFSYDVRDSQGRLCVVKGVSLAEHINRLDKTRRYLLGALQEMTADEFRSIRSFEGYDVTPEWVIHHLIQHEAEHRGQILVIRLLAEKKIRIE